MRLITLLGVLIMSSMMLIGCSVPSLSNEESTEEESTVIEPAVLERDFLKNAVNAYSEEIGETIPGERIVEKNESQGAVEFSVYIFDDTGFTHRFYEIAYNPEDFEYNQTERLDGLDVDTSTVVIDDVYNLVRYDLKHVELGDNGYNYFRNKILNEFQTQADDLGKSVEDMNNTLLYDDRTYSIIGKLDEYVKPLPPLEEDEEGYTLCDTSDRCWTYVVNGDDEIVITGYSNEQYGNKLIIPPVINGKTVYGVNHLDPVAGVTCIEVSEGIVSLQGSFTNWSDLNRLILHDGLAYITKNAIDGTNITSIDLPQSIIGLEDGFFSKFNVGTVSDFNYSITDFTGFYQGSDITSIIIPKTIQTICTDAFKNCDSLTTVFIEDGCQKIEDGAFLGADNLQAVAIPASVTYIGLNVFEPDTLLVVSKGSVAENYAIDNDLQYSIQ